MRTPENAEPFFLTGSRPDHLQARIHGLALASPVREPPQEGFGGKDDRAENANEDQGTKPDRVHPSSLWLG
ncbi:MAG: hypothetical protein ACREBK_03725 [Sphingomicrobium sp.]